MRAEAAEKAMVNVVIEILIEGLMVLLLLLLARSTKKCCAQDEGRWNRIDKSLKILFLNLYLLTNLWSSC